MRSISLGRFPPSAADRLLPRAPPVASSPERRLLSERRRLSSGSATASSTPARPPPQPRSGLPAPDPVCAAALHPDAAASTQTTPDPASPRRIRSCAAAASTRTTPPPPDPASPRRIRSCDAATSTRTMLPPPVAPLRERFCPKATRDPSAYRLSALKRPLYSAFWNLVCYRVTRCSEIAVCLEAIQSVKLSKVLYMSQGLG